MSSEQEFDVSHLVTLLKCRIPVRINVSIPRMKCEFLGIDIQVKFRTFRTTHQVMTFSSSCKDDQGRHEVGMVENTVKTPIGMNQEGCLFEAR